MKNETVKTITIILKPDSGIFGKRHIWIFDTSDKTAEIIKAAYENESKIMSIDNVPTKHGFMTLMINKNEIKYITIE